MGTQGTQIADWCTGSPPESDSLRHIRMVLFISPERHNKQPASKLIGRDIIRGIDRACHPLHSSSPPAGQWEEALHVWQQMQASGVPPTHVTYHVVTAACHTGLSLPPPHPKSQITIRAARVANELSRGISLDMYEFIQFFECACAKTWKRRAVAGTQFFR